MLAGKTSTSCQPPRWTSAIVLRPCMLSKEMTQRFSCVESVRPHALNSSGRSSVSGRVSRTTCSIVTKRWTLSVIVPPVACGVRILPARSYPHVHIVVHRVASPCRFSFPSMATETGQPFLDLLANGWECVDVVALELVAGVVVAVVGAIAGLDLTAVQLLSLIHI